MPAPQPLRILCVHGIGQHPVGGPWQREWCDAIEAPLARVAPSVRPEFEFVHYDALFQKHKVGLFDTIEALAKLTASGISAPFRARGLERGLTSSLRWTAGMVVKWVESDRFRRETRELLTARLRRFSDSHAGPPDVVLAHSLGSLVAYDTLTTVAGLDLTRTRLVTFGSQIANPFVSGQFLAGRIEVPKGLGAWTHLYNSEDAAFAAPIRLSDARFEQLTTFFDEPGMLDHSAPRYLAHPATQAGLWAGFGTSVAGGMRGFGAVAAPRRAARATPSRRRTSPRRRALLVGINEYAAPEDRLEGCVNDVFLMSSLLQESGYAAEDIRIVLDKRATAKGIRERLEWLLDGIEADDTEGDDAVERVFYYSGHGAQMPTYGQGDKVDRMDETLVPWDFDWSPEHALTDDAFHDLYAQLPYGLRFLTIFDCCHSGGMTRDGGPKVRGLTPPDDIRHRALRWNADVEMWQPRDLEPLNKDFLDRHTATVKSKARGAEQRAGRMTNRLGFSMSLRGLEDRAFTRRRAALGHKGPYMPLLLYACREDEVAMEYRHGAVSHGAFTYSLAKNVRNRRKAPRSAPPTFEALVKSVQGDLRALGYEQHPELAGPSVARKANVPFATGAVAGRRARRS
ncbi:MAG: caspase family protein [Planctomycetes bacterium]|nr:caspase family protein [Planctomycetota bacterium]